MECHCKDHLPGDYHKHDGCDCGKHDFPTYSFVVTKVIDDGKDFGSVYISPQFMETLDLSDGDPVELVGSEKRILKAKPHPNRWMDARMICLDSDTMDKAGLQLFGQVKLRKTLCLECEIVFLEVPDGISISRSQARSMLEEAEGTIVTPGEHLVLSSPKCKEVRFRVVETDPGTMSRVTRATRVRLMDSNGEEYVSRHDTTFKDVGGLEDAVRKVKEIVQLPLSHPEIFVRLGIDPPRGVLLHGPSGTGKTLIARAVANETGCYFKGISGTEVMDKYYGESEAKLRAAFEDAYKNAPAIIFIDEIDALAPKREKSDGDVEKRVTAQLLALMDGMEDRGSVIVLAATNLPNSLDQALRRPGRFDREILVGVPDRVGRREIMGIHSRNMPLGEVDLDDLAHRTHGFVGADLKALCRESAYNAMRRILPGIEDTEQQLSEDFLEAITVEMEDFEQALTEMRPSSIRNFEVDLRKAGWNFVAGYSTETDFIKDMILWPMQHAADLGRMGVEHPEGLLITGPSGTGKTLIARSLAKESGFNVIEIKGAELLSKYMGESERNIRELFKQAQQMAPTVLILDGMDAMTASGWSDSKVIDRVVNQLALEMSSIENDRPILVAATAGRPEDVPLALRSTGRFGHELRLNPPGPDDRAELFNMLLDPKKVDFLGNYREASRISEGLTGGDIEEVCRRVLLQAARQALETGADLSCRLCLKEEDLLKMLDRWKLARTAGTESK
jgi:transitional endoplasmic reticulum ATPase